MLKIEINGNVLTVKLDDDQLKIITEVIEKTMMKEIRRQVKKIIKEEAKAK